MRANRFETGPGVPERVSKICTWLKIVIDYLVKRQKSRVGVNNVKYKKRASCGSDHPLLKVQIVFPITTGYQQGHVEKGKVSDEKYKNKIYSMGARKYKKTVQIRRK